MSALPSTNHVLSVAKFGGTSVADHAAMLRCAYIISQGFSSHQLVVVSASAGVTNLLVELACSELTAEQKLLTLNKIKQIQWDICKQLKNTDEIFAQVTALLLQLADLVNLQQQGFDEARADEILAFGERLSSFLFTQVLCQQGLKAHCFDARTVMRTNSLFSQAQVDINQLAQRVEQQLVPLLSDHIVVTQGFIGADEFGHTTTLGRGGSDYSAALFAEALKAQQLAIWTDVQGIFTTDPRITEQAKSIAHISFDEAAEMATFGAKILHPATLLPAIRSNIKVFVGSSKAPEKGGTFILPEVEQSPTYRAVSLRRQQTLVTVKSPEMLHASGFLAHVFNIIAKHELSVDLVTTSEISVALTLDNPPNSANAKLTQKVVAELSEFCDVTVEQNLALIALIGNRLHQQADVAKEVFGQINNLQIRLICHGASEHNLCFLVDDNQANAVVEQLHQRLF